MSKKQKNIESTVVDSLMDIGKHIVAGAVKMASTKTIYISALETGTTTHVKIAESLAGRKDSDARTRAIDALSKIRASLNNDERTDIIGKANDSSSEEITAESIGLPPKRLKDTQEGQGVIVSLCEMLIAYLYCLFAKGEGQDEFTFVKLSDNGQPIVNDEDDNEIEITLSTIFAKAFDSTSGEEDSLNTQIANPLLKLEARLAVISKVTRGVADCLKGTNGKMRDEWAAMVKALRAAQAEERKAEKAEEKKQAIREKATATVDEYLTVKGAFKAMFEHAGELLSQDGFDKLPKGTDKRRDALVNNDEVAADLAKGARSEIVKAMKSVK